MRLRFFFIIILSLITFGVALFNSFPQYVGEICALGVILALPVAFFGERASKKRQLGPKLDIPSKIEGDEEEEYHNDFSRVPGGSADDIPPPPKSLGFNEIVDQTLYEDLERIGIKKDDQKDKKL